jgi:DNA processing protein
MVVIVGARNATINGRKISRTLATDLGKASCAVITGMARSIDGAAYEGACSASEAKTIAVLVSGTNVIYPPEHDDLYEKITNAGAVISKIPPGTELQAALFPSRNRIISRRQPRDRRG